MQELEENKIGLENVRICYSPFARTLHTAKVVASVLNIPFEGPQCKVSMSLALSAKTALLRIYLLLLGLWIDDDDDLTFFFIFSLVLPLTNNNLIQFSSAI